MSTHAKKLIYILMYIFYKKLTMMVAVTNALRVICNVSKDVTHTDYSDVNIEVS